MRARYGEHVYTRYGFLDAFNPTLDVSVHVRRGRVVPGIGWFDDDHLGIDQGPIVLMIENHRSGLVWDVMKRNAYIVRGLCRSGFGGGWLEGRCAQQPGAETRTVPPTRAPADPRTQAFVDSILALMKLVGPGTFTCLRRRQLAGDPRGALTLEAWRGRRPPGRGVLHDAAVAATRKGAIARAPCSSRNVCRRIPPTGSTCSSRPRTRTRSARCVTACSTGSSSRAA